MGKRGGGNRGGGKSRGGRSFSKKGKGKQGKSYDSKRGGTWDKRAEASSVPDHSPDLWSFHSEPRTHTHLEVRAGPPPGTILASRPSHEEDEWGEPEWLSTIHDMLDAANPEPMVEPGSESLEAIAEARRANSDW